MDDKKRESNRRDGDRRQNDVAFQGPDRRINDRRSGRDRRNP